MLFFETIALEQNRPRHLFYHQQRVNKTAKAHGFQAIELASYLHNLQGQKAKIVYGKEGVHSVTATPYISKNINSLQLCYTDVNYCFKYLDRSVLETHVSTTADEMLFVVDGLLTDTSIANTAFLYNNQWITPKIPLLEGTTRARLLDKGMLAVADIDANDLDKMEKIAVMNAMIGFKPLSHCQICKGEKCILTL